MVNQTLTMFQRKTMQADEHICVKRCKAMLRASVYYLQVQQLEVVADKYVGVVAQNAALHNEVQDLKGSIRVFCRVRPAGATGDPSPPCTSASVDGEVHELLQ
jgi:Microtubule binding